MAIDDVRLRDLLEQSQDLHSDAMTTTRTSLDELVELGHEERREPRRERSRRRCAVTRWSARFPTTGILAAAGLGTAMVALLAQPRVRRQGDGRADAADGRLDREPGRRDLRHRADARLHRWRVRDPRRQGVREKTRDQHKEHGDAFNAASTRLGGTKQDQPDPVLLGVVNNAKPTLTGPAAGRRPRARAREHRGGDLRRQRRRLLQQERTSASPPASWVSRRSTPRSSTR